MVGTERTLTQEERKQQGFASLKNFWQVKRKPRRPKKRKSEASDTPKFDEVKRGRGRPSKKNDADPTPKASKSTEASTPSDSPPSPFKKKAKRVNWGLEENKKKLDKAVEEWDDQSGRALDGNGEPMKLPAFANIVEGQEE